MMSVQERLSVARPPARAPCRGAEANRPPTALILGTGDIASAIGRGLFLRGWRVVLLRDNGVPVLRRGMAFDDALEDGVAVLDGVIAVPAAAPGALPALLSARPGVVVANLDPAVLAASGIDRPDALVDARMRKYAMPADLRPLAGCAIGVGPGFVAGGNVHIAIETLPGQEGGVVTRGPTAVPTGEAVPLGGAGAERFVYAPIAGVWQPEVPLGAWIEPGTLVRPAWSAAAPRTHRRLHPRDGAGGAGRCRPRQQADGDRSAAGGHVHWRAAARPADRRRRRSRAGRAADDQRRAGRCRIAVAGRRRAARPTERQAPASATLDRNRYNSIAALSRPLALYRSRSGSASHRPMEIAS
jgi:hypothetical protein